MFGKIKSLFILEDNDESKKAVQKAKDEEKKTEKAGPTANAEDITADIEPSSTPQSGKPDPKFVDILLKAVEKSNLGGFDYLEYKSSLQSLSGMDMDEMTRYKSSLAMASTMGATKEKLIETAKHYLKTLEGEKGKFQDALKAQRAKQVTGKESSVQKIEQGIEAKQKKIAELQQQIEMDKQKMQEMKKNIQKAAAKVQNTNDNFHYAYNMVSGQILNDIEKMNEYL